MWVRAIWMIYTLINFFPFLIYGTFFDNACTLILAVNQDFKEENTCKPFSEAVLNGFWGGTISMHQVKAFKMKLQKMEKKQLYLNGFYALFFHCSETLVDNSMFSPQKQIEAVIHWSSSCNSSFCNSWNILPPLMSTQIRIQQIEIFLFNLINSSIKQRPILSYRELKLQD